MATLFITEQGSTLRKTSDRLIVEKDGAVLLEIQCLKIETVLLYGNVQVTSQALAEMLDHGIELALLSRNGRLRGQSVFECRLQPKQLDRLRERVRSMINPEEDSLRIYVFCRECQGRIESLGTGKVLLEDPDVYLL